MGEKGFTILDIIIVIVIIGILGAVLYPKFSGKEAPSKIAGTEMTIFRFYEAAKSYKTNHGRTDFTNATKANIIADGLIADVKNSFGNVVNVGPKAGDATQIEITTNADNVANAQNIVDRLTAKNYSAAVAGVTVTFTAK